MSQRHSSQTRDGQAKPEARMLEANHRHSWESIVRVNPGNRVRRWALPRFRPAAGRKGALFCRIRCLQSSEKVARKRTARGVRRCSSHTAAGTHCSGRELVI